ncbi:aminodeoxychorismate synthase component I [Pseudoduganella sp. GCM10020061]|uniref:aminodeoxychorismate synthase component I n=1 Tax=Pseudoduganella sp. GCM10020061 TaxID=3317345 RepID=UPI00362EDB88
MHAVECFALLDDAGSVDGSRLFTGHVRTLRADTAGEWPLLLAELQQALESGLYGVPLLTYELGCALHGIPAHAAQGPLARVLLFERCDRLGTDEVGAWVHARAGTAPSGVAAVAASVDEAQFTDAIERIRDYIRAGDTYQVNYTYRLRFDAYGSLFALYARLRERQPVPYGALIALPDGSGVLSLSPELFVRHTAGELMTRPMKGTAPASGDAAEDQRRAQALAQDPKNRAENLMIVDLLRNDLGRVCETGSVQVPALFDVTRFGSVLQMTSTVRGRLRASATLADIFDAIYPCGSITGAPKRRTMEIITEVETAPRGIYTGAIGWFDPPAASGKTGDFCLSVPIRTLALSPPEQGVRRGELGVGAGIVYDSEPASEYAECQLKARFLTGMPAGFGLFETMQATGAGCRNVEEHLARMSASARYFAIPFDRDAARRLLDDACQALGGPARMKLALAPDGTLDVQVAPLAPLAQPVRILVAEQAVRSDDLFLRHKSTVRERYDAAWREAEAHGAFDMVFFNEKGELAEGGRSNVFVKVGGRWCTPPLSCGLLPGVMRAAILRDPAFDAVERVITRAEFDAATEIMVCNSLRGALAAQR